ncbi:uncharacterized protein LOC141856394 [Brevipalpus obovatus]|uniref:uncharacterized protein LOC141856394 n=1 Tax=Brevipalpus obovatus TaxID=246614 RepID=UPI003D9F8104
MSCGKSEIYEIFSSKKIPLKSIENSLDGPRAEHTSILSEIEVNVLYVFGYSDARDYKCDQYSWKWGSTTNIKGSLVNKTYMYLMTKGRKNAETTNKFRKILYRKHGSPNFVIIYDGNKELAHPISHGNCKVKALHNSSAFSSFLQVSKESSGHEIAVEKKHENLEPRISTTQDLYEGSNQGTESYEPAGLKRSNQSEESGESNSFTQYSGHSIPSELEQVAYPRNQGLFKDSMDERNRLNIYNIYVLAKNELKNYIHLIEMIPHQVVVFGSQEAFALLNKLIANTEKDPQIIYYGTVAVNSSDLYVSALIAQNTELERAKIWPVAFMAHDSEEPEVHKTFWRFLVDKIKFNARIPIVIDRKEPIANAISQQGLDRNLLYCVNHIESDVERWLTMKGASEEEIIENRSLIGKLIESRDGKEYKTRKKIINRTGSSKLLQYFFDELEVDIQLYCIARRYSNFTAFNDKTKPINKVGEFMVNMLKFGDDKEISSVDHLIYRLLEPQITVLREFDEPD